MNPVLGQPPAVYNPYGAPAALPAGWIEHYTPTGQPYWFNTFINQSSWVFPMAPAPKKKQIKKKIPDTHWLFVLTHDGYEFYYDRETKKSVWEMPEELKEPLEELKRLEEKEKEDKKLQEENKKRALLEQEEQAVQEAKRIKLEEEKDNVQEEATEMTEEDIMWQLQQMEGQESDIEEHSQQEELEEEPKEIPQEEEKTEKIPELSDQDRIDKFNELLKESNISPFAVYSVEYPKLMTDSRFSLVPHKKQKGLFNKYCHELGEKIRVEKAKEIKRPEDEFQELLESKVTTKIYWEDFRRKFKDDPRFKALPTTRAREALFKEHVKHNLNQKKNPIEEYNNLLSNTKEIQKDTRWRDAKKILENHNAYYAIEDKDKREDLFRDYLEQL